MIPFYNSAGRLIDSCSDSDSGIRDRSIDIETVDESWWFVRMRIGRSCWVLLVRIIFVSAIRN